MAYYFMRGYNNCLFLVESERRTENSRKYIGSFPYFVLMLLILHSTLGCVQRLPDLAMLTQSSQGVRHCNDTERRVSIRQMSRQYFLFGKFSTFFIHSFAHSFVRSLVGSFVSFTVWRLISNNKPVRVNIFALFGNTFSQNSNNNN